MRLILAAIVLLASVPAYAGFYQFTLGGHVTESSHPAVDVGDPFTIYYVANSMDREPSATLGSYAATPATVHYPNVTITSIGFEPDGVSVALLPSVDRVTYLHAFGLETFFGVVFGFPPQTLKSDALPLSLPLSGETFGLFHERRSPRGYDIRGQVTSYASVEVPEPSALGLVVTALALTPMHRRRA